MSEIAAATERIAKLENRIVKLTGQRDELKYAKESLEQARKMNQELLTKKENDAAKTIEDLQRKLDKAHKELVAAKTQPTASERAAFEKNKANAIAHITRASQILEAEKEKNEILTKRIQDLESGYEAIKKEGHLAKNENEALKKKIEELENHLEHQESRSKVVLNERATAEKEAKKVNRNLNALIDNQKNLESQIQSLKTKVLYHKEKQEKEGKKRKEAEEALAETLKKLKPVKIEHSSQEASTSKTDTSNEIVAEKTQLEMKLKEVENTLNLERNNNLATISQLSAEIANLRLQCDQDREKYQLDLQNCKNDYASILEFQTNRNSELAKENEEQKTEIGYLSIQLRAAERKGYTSQVDIVKTWKHKHQENDEDIQPEKRARISHLDPSTPSSSPFNDSFQSVQNQSRTHMSPQVTPDKHDVLSKFQNICENVKKNSSFQR